MTYATLKRGDIVLKSYSKATTTKRRVYVVTAVDVHKPGYNGTDAVEIMSPSGKKEIVNKWYLITHDEKMALLGNEITLSERHLDRVKKEIEDLKDEKRTAKTLFPVV